MSSQAQTGGPVSSKNDPIADFFDALAEVGHVLRLARHAGAVRFDVIDPDGVSSWRVDITKGDVKVSQDDSPADAVIRGDRAVLEGIFTGNVNAVAATLRGVLVVEGNWDLVVLCQRLFADVAAAQRASIEGTSV